MNDIRDFVDLFYDCCRRSDYQKEEDQKLPSKEILEKVSRILYHTSCMREENRYPSFRVCFIRPDSELLDAYLYARTLLFETPVPFETKSLHKLAPALNADMSYLLLDLSRRPFQAVGIVYSYTAWEKIMAGEVSGGNRMPLIPNIYVKGPGELEACYGETPLVSYQAGNCFFFRTDTFTSTLVAEKLRTGSRVAEADCKQLLYRILWRTLSYRHGGLLFIVPSSEAYKEVSSIKYKMSCKFPSKEDETYAHLPAESRRKLIIAYADMIAKLTTVDGAVVLTKDLDLLGFGAEARIDRISREKPRMRFIGQDNQVNFSKSYDDNGMRHRACYSFCNGCEDAVAIIVSQDGTVKACTKHDGEVVVYDHVGLPLL